MPIERSGYQCNACQKSDVALSYCECKGLTYCSEECFKSEFRGHEWWCCLVEEYTEEEIMGDIPHDDSKMEENQTAVGNATSDDEDVDDNEWKVCWSCEKVFSAEVSVPCPKQSCLKVYCSAQCAKRDHRQGCGDTSTLYNTIEYTASIERHMLILGEHREQLAREKKKKGKRGNKAR